MHGSARNKAGVKDLRFHDLRHEAISRFFEMGMSVPGGTHIHKDETIVSILISILNMSLKSMMPSKNTWDWCASVYRHRAA